MSSSTSPPQICWPGAERNSPEQHTFPSGQQNWVPRHHAYFVAQVTSCFRDQSFDGTRSPSIRSLESCPLGGKRSTLSPMGWPSEIIPPTGSKAEAAWALVIARGVASASKVRKRRNGPKSPILAKEERSKRGACMGGKGQRTQKKPRFKIGVLLILSPPRENRSFTTVAPLFSPVAPKYGNP